MNAPNQNEENLNIIIPAVAIGAETPNNPRNKTDTTSKVPSPPGRKLAIAIKSASARRHISIIGFKFIPIASST